MRHSLEGRRARHALVAPGSPWQNWFAKGFIGTFRCECLDPEVFRNLADAQVKLAAYRRDHNDFRPHSSLGYRPPAVASRDWEPARATPSQAPNPHLSQCLKV